MTLIPYVDTDFELKYLLTANYSVGLCRLIHTECTLVLVQNGVNISTFIGFCHKILHRHLWSPMEEAYWLCWSWLFIWRRHEDVQLHLWSSHLLDMFRVLRGIQGKPKLWFYWNTSIDIRRISLKYGTDIHIAISVKMSVFHFYFGLW